MLISRRAFTSGALGAAAALQLPGRLRAATSAVDLAPALTAIAAYAEANRRYYGIPGLTLGLSLPDGSSRTLNFGYADREAQTPIRPDTLFEVGSLSKMMTAVLLHQLASQGRFSLSDRVSKLLPDIPLPAGNSIQVQHLLDHVAGIATDAPVRPASGLWTAYAPGEHWHYSNTGYEILGLIAEKIGGKPLPDLLNDRLFRPLGMSRTTGAILDVDRAKYARGYEVARQPFVPGDPLVPASWIDMTSAVGNVGSTADDMNRLMRSLADAAQGRGGLGLPPALARTFTTHAVQSDTPGMTYGNAIMHVSNDGRSYLHHTGGMVGFSSSYHLDTASGTAAFASVNIGYLAEYRPRLLTRFAADALTNALAGKAPPAPPPLNVLLTVPAAYTGRFSGPGGSFDIRVANGELVILSGGRSAPLLPVGGDLFRTSHPAFHRFTLMFERRGATIAGIAWGPLTYLRLGGGGEMPVSNPQLAKLAGRYANASPWFGSHEVVERGGELWIGTELPLTPIGDNLWRVGMEPWTPERASFADFTDGRPATFIWSGEKFARKDG